MEFYDELDPLTEDYCQVISDPGRIMREYFESFSN